MTPQPMTLLLHTVFFHASFGLGLGAAGALNNKLFTRNPTHSEANSI